MKEREERDQGLKRGRGINALFELCKIAAWERGGVCVCVSECECDCVTEEAERRKEQRRDSTINTRSRGEIGFNARKIDGK